MNYLSTFLLIAVSVLVTSSAQLFIKQGISSVGSSTISSANLLSLIFIVLQNAWMVTGLFLFGLSFLLWIFILSRIQLNVVYPLVVSLNFILIVIASWLFFKEQLSLFQILGIVVIISGIFLLLQKAIA